MSNSLSLATIEIETTGVVAIVRFNRPQARNAIDDQLRHDLRAAVDRLAADDAVRGVILTGAGNAFCSGGDIRGMEERIQQGARAGELGWWRQREFHETLTKLFYLGKPTVAAVNGPAFGLGFDLAMTCDFVFLAEGAQVAVNFVRRGLVSDGGGLFHLPRRVGLSRAKQLLFSGRTIDSAEALSIGLADRVCQADALLAEARELLLGFAEHPATAQAMMKSILNRSLDLSFEEINTLASQAQAYCYSSADHQESVRAFLAERDRARAAKPVEK